VLDIGFACLNVFRGEKQSISEEGLFMLSPQLNQAFNEHIDVFGVKVYQLILIFGNDLLVGFHMVFASGILPRLFLCGKEVAQQNIVNQLGVAQMNFRVLVRVVFDPHE